LRRTPRLAVTIVRRDRLKSPQKPLLFGRTGYVGANGTGRALGGATVSLTRLRVSAGGTHVADDDHA
jgi:hypothetical protein